MLALYLFFDRLYVIRYKAQQKHNHFCNGDHPVFLFYKEKKVSQ